MKTIKQYLEELKDANVLEWARIIGNLKQVSIEIEKENILERIKILKGKAIESFGNNDPIKEFEELEFCVNDIEKNIDQIKKIVNQEECLEGYIKSIDDFLNSICEKCSDGDCKKCDYKRIALELLGKEKLKVYSMPVPKSAILEVKQEEDYLAIAKKNINRAKLSKYNRDKYFIERAEAYYEKAIKQIKESKKMKCTRCSGNGKRVLENRR